MDWYPWYPTLFQIKTLHLTACQDGIYRRLLDWYMVNRHPIPDNDQAIASIARIGLDEWLQNGSSIRPFFHPKQGSLYHKRCDAELDRQDARSKTRSEIAKKGAEARWNGNNNLDASGTRSASVQHASVHATRQDKTRDKKEEEIEGALAPDLSQAAVNVWNDLAKELGLPQVQRLTKTRLGKLKARLSECGGLEGWSAACAKVRAAGWMAGDNDKGWKADFDFMLQERSFTKLMEGSYDRAKSHRQSFGNGFAAIAAGEVD